ncbi:MAG: glycosyltransferase [Solirubrobacterales bacterium]
MKIAWFTPFHVESAIGEFSRHVTDELARVADVELWVPGDGPLLESELPMVGFNADSPHLSDLHQYDAIVYNLGNHLAFHGEIYKVSAAHPGAVILHDRALHHLFADLWLTGEHPEPVRYIQAMGAYYGADGASVAQESLQGGRRPVWESEQDLLRYPLYEQSIAGALGVVTHSQGQALDVAQRWLGPVAALRLPCYRETLACAARAPRAAPSERLRLLTVGHVNSNKQVDRVVKVLAADPQLAARFSYRVVGPDGGDTAYARGLRRLIEQHADVLDVVLVGRVSDEQLEAELAAADAFVNLRHPNIEGGSASLMRQLAYGRPVLAFDSGFFGEIPGEALLRVPVADFGAVARQLHALVTDAAMRERVGRAAREFAEACSERTYVEDLLRLIEQGRSAAPALRLLDLVARELGRMQVDPRLPVFDDVARDFGPVLDV